MEQHAIINVIIFSGIFLALSSFIQIITGKSSFPYTVALLLVGLAGQLLVNAFDINPHLGLSPEIIFYVFLPLLIFEAAMHINFHQFKLQFKTVAFAATFGVMLSMFIIGVLVSLLLGLPFMVALLFGAIISETDPMAVLALFKELGAPKRLSLIMDGESMINDASGIVAFKLISGFVLAGTYFGSKDLLGNIGEIGAVFGQFSYVFIGSLIVGAVIGYIATYIIGVLQGDRLVENTLILALALGSFILAEHYLGMSGAITTLIAGIILGNFGLSKLSAEGKEYIHNFWGYIVYLCVSMVFFFATFNLNLNIFTSNIGALVIVVLIALIARAISVYISFYLSNHLSFFKNEPNVQTNWQHVINWGGLRGVIPLILVYSLPETFAYRELLVGFTLSTILFTLFVNGLTVKWLMMKLGLHLPKKEEEIIQEELTIFEIEESKQRLAQLPTTSISRTVLSSIKKALDIEENQHRNKLLAMVTPTELLNSLRLESLQIEKDYLHQLYADGYITESVFYEFESELDLQQDALEYPEIYQGRGYSEGGKIESNKAFQKMLENINTTIKKHPLLKWFINPQKKQIIKDRYSLLRVRIVVSEKVLNYLERVEKIMGSNKVAMAALKIVSEEHLTLIKHNKEKITELIARYTTTVQGHQENLLSNLVNNKTASPVF